MAMEKREGKRFAITCLKNVFCDRLFASSLQPSFSYESEFARTLRTIDPEQDIKIRKNKKSIPSIFFMSLSDRQDLLDNHEFFLFIDLVKCGVTSGNMKPVDDNPAF